MKVAAVTADDGKTFHRGQKQQKTTSNMQALRIRASSQPALCSLSQGTLSQSCYSGLGSLRCVLPHIECPPAIALVCFRIPFPLSAILTYDAAHPAVGGLDRPRPIFGRYLATFPTGIGSATHISRRRRRGPELPRY